MTKGKKSGTVNEDKNTEFDIVLGEKEEKDWLSMIKAANVINDEVSKVCQCHYNGEVTKY